MIRFSYTDITKKQNSCRECEKFCKSNVFAFGCTDIQVKQTFIVKVSDFPRHDLKMLRKQISDAKSSAKVTIGMHTRNSFVSPEQHPTIGECQIFIDVMDIFAQHLEENKRLLQESKSTLYYMLNTIIVVVGNKIISSSKDKGLNTLLKVYAQNTGNKFTDSEPVFNLEESI